MIERHKISLQSWVDGQNTERIARLMEDRDWKKAAEKEKKDWRQRGNEDAKYLTESGTLRIFQDAAHIIRRGFCDITGGPKADIVKPEYSVEQKETHIKLEWDTEAIYAGHNIVGWENRQVLCFVERAGGIPQGLRINDIDEVIPVDKEILSERLIQSIKAAQARPKIRNGEIAKPG